ncbi:MAG: hypothetical protein WBP29_01615 [Candidatus Zixiibacteriota bacterium]
MKKICALMLALFVLSAVPVMAEMTGDEIIAKHVEASGGEAAMRGVKSLYLKGSMFAQGMALEMQTYLIPPAKSYVEVSMNNMVVGGGGTNGTEAWATQMGETYVLTGKQKEEADKQSDQFVFLDYKKKGATAKNLGEDVVKGAKAYKVEFVTAGHDTTQYFFDAQTYYLLRETSAATSQNFSKHKEVGGIVFPFSISSQLEMGGQSMQQMITFDSVAVNIPIADSLFVMPKNAKPMPTPGAAPEPAETPKVVPPAGGGK